HREGGDIYESVNSFNGHSYPNNPRYWFVLTAWMPIPASGQAGSSPATMSRVKTPPARKGCADCPVIAPVPGAGCTTANRGTILLAPAEEHLPVLVPQPAIRITYGGTRCLRHLWLPARSPVLPPLSPSLRLHRKSSMPSQAQSAPSTMRARRSPYFRTPVRRASFTSS